MWLWYRRALAVAYVVVFFTAAQDYLFWRGMVSAPPLYWIVALGALSLPLTVTPFTLSRVLTSPLTWWCGFYAAFTLMAFMWSSQSATALSELRIRLLAVFFVVSLLLVFADERVHPAVLQAILCSALLAVALNVVDLARPLTFSPIPGRAAGLYFNPNMSAVALVLGMIMGVNLVPPALRAWFVCLVGGGVLLTFSRGGAVVWVCATMSIVGSRAVRLAPFLRAAAFCAVALAGTLLISGMWNTVLQAASVVSSDAWTNLRLGTGVSDASSAVRLGAARLSWEMFAEQPWTGWGVGATTEWDWSESTHNIYLRHLAEYGTAGIVIVPLLVFVLFRQRAAARAGEALWLAVVVTVWGIFSHNILDERHFLICIALVCSRPRHVPANAANAYD